LPKVTFVDLWKPFVQIMMVKSHEEIAMFRKAALILEVAAEEFVDACKLGNTVADIESAYQSKLIPYGAEVWPLTLPVCSIGFGPDGGRGIAWLAHGLKPPVISKGDLVECELMANVGSLHAQALIAVSIGEPSAEKVKLATLARESYEIGVRMIRPGITFGQLAEAMAEPNKREDAWQLSPLVHSLNPHEPVSDITVGVINFTGVKERLGDVPLLEPKMERADLVIEEGMLFEIEPNSAYGRTYVAIGGNAIVTKRGCEELNKIPTRMVVVDV
jgi:Xaa-Pro aminopeptidase